jgi:hypothetical protein
MSEKHSLYRNPKRTAARKQAKQRLRAAQGAPPKPKPTTLDEALVDKEAEG